MRRIVPALALVILGTSTAFGQSASRPTVTGPVEVRDDGTRVVYRTVETLDLDGSVLTGKAPGPTGISVNSHTDLPFEKMIPERTNFTLELTKSALR
jgi:hypothetical protein